jgi:NitT/TauT family transport system ATP-binding protein
MANETRPDVTTPVAKGPAANGERISIELEHIDCVFRQPSRTAAEYIAIRDLNLRVAEGEFVAVVGPTGCGKSTILNLTAGLLHPSAGAVRIFGAPLAGLNRRAGYLFQADPLMPWRTAAQNVALGLHYRGVERHEANQRAAEWLERVGLAGRGHVYPHQLSGGMKKRVSLAQTLIVDPEIILMDEPFSALDVQTRLLMETELLDIWAANRKSVLFITHDLEEAILLSDRVVVLSAGPATRAIGEFAVDLPRPRDISEMRHAPQFVELHQHIWHVMKDEVLKGYARTKGNN